MTVSPLTQPVARRSRWATLLLALLITLTGLPGLGATPALALPGDPLDPEPIGPPRRFIPPPNGFRWEVASRFGQYRDGLVDFHWDAASMTYDPAYVHPSRFPVNFNGCRTAEEDQTGVSVNTYRWDLNGQTIIGNQCGLAYSFPAQGAYTVRLTITDPAGQPVPAGKTPPYFQQVVTARDYLIVSIGDSFASGEGNPDIPGVLGIGTDGKLTMVQPPAWQDKRCHRSALAGPAQAALAIEAADPKTSVTFLSFACSGATINTLHWDMIGLGEIVDPLRPDPNKPIGTGILGPYRGIEFDSDSYRFDDYIRPQLQQVRDAIGGRRIDALIISGGGNDIHFGDVAQACLLVGNCWLNAGVTESPGNGPFRLEALINRALGQTSPAPADNLPANYARLAEETGGLNVANVYITEYPDLTRDDSGGYCRMLDDIFWPNPLLAFTPPETQMASEFALTSLNRAVQAAATRYGWRYVGGVAAEFVSDAAGKGHGYCASDNWIRRADESAILQGPFGFRAGTKGTLHPTARGHQVYRQRLVEAIQPNLNPGAVLPPLPTFTTRLTDGFTSSRQGAGGWLTGRCIGSTCYSDRVVLQTIAYAPDRITAANMAINGVTGCTVSGVTCAPPQLSTDRKTLTWTITIARDGIYRLQFSARDSSQQTATFTHEVKVDLNDPTATATIPPGLPTSGGAYTVPVDVTLAGSDPAGGSGVGAIEYRLDGGAPTLVAPGGTVRINVGSHTLAYRAIDGAGRASAMQTLPITVMPTVSLAGDKDNFGTNTSAGTAIRLVDMVYEPDDGDFDQNGRWCGQQFFRWSHTYPVPAGATVRSAKLTVVSWNLRDGNLMDGRRYWDTRLTLDGQEVAGAFDTVVTDVIHHLVPGNANTTVFQLAPALLPSLADGRLDVVLDAYAGGTLQCFALDYGELELVFDDATTTSAGNR